VSTARQRLVLVAPFLPLFLVGLTVGHQLAGASSAEAGAPCQTDESWNTVFEPTNPNTGRGARVNDPGADIFNPSLNCGRVNSIWVHDAAWVDFVEIGYYEDNSYYICVPNTSGPPEVLAFEQNSTGVDCDQSTPQLTGSAVALTVSDANQDGYWNFSYDGSSVFVNAESMGFFSSGIVGNNGERGSGDDNARANFRGLKRMGSNSNWSDWDQTHLDNDVEGDDLGYKGCKYNDTHTSVILTSGSC